MHNILQCFLLLQGFGDCFKRTAHEFICTKILYSFLQWCHWTEQQIREKIYCHTLEKTMNRTIKERLAFENHKKSCQIDKFFQIKTVYIIFKTGSEEWWIYTHWNSQIFCHFLPPESVIKDNLQQHRLQMYNCTKTESKHHYKCSYISKACQNTTTRRLFYSVQLLI